MSSSFQDEWCCALRYVKIAMSWILALPFLVPCYVSQPSINADAAQVSQFLPQIACNREYLAMARDKTASVWSLKDGCLLRSFAGHGEKVVRVSLSPDRKSLLSSSFVSPSSEINTKSADDSIRLWAIRSGRQILRIDHATHGIFSMDGTKIFGLVQRKMNYGSVGGFDLAAWNVKTGKRLYIVSLPNDGASPEYAFSLQEARTSRRLLFAQHRTAIVCDSASGQIVNENISSMQYSNNTFLNPSGSRLQMANYAGVSYISVPESRTTETIDYPGDSHWEVGWEPSGLGFAAVNLDGLLAWKGPQGSYSQAKTSVAIPRQVEVLPGSAGILVNWGGGNISPLGFVPQTVSAFDLRCQPLWHRAGKAIRLQQGTEVVVLDGLNLSVVNFSSGSILRRITLAGAGPEPL